MKIPRRFSLAAAALALAACAEPSTQPANEAAVTPPVAGRSVVVGTLTCTVDLVAGTSRCAPEAPEPGGARKAVTLDSGTHFDLVTVSSQRDLGLDIAVLWQAIESKVGQALGTTDGSTVHSDGIRAVVVSGPTVTSGSGAISITNHSGTMTLTAANQKYFEYEEILEPFTTGSNSNWQFSLDDSVLAFTFTVKLYAPVQCADGHIVLTSSSSTVNVNSSVTVTGVVKSWNGTTNTSATFIEWDGIPDADVLTGPVNSRQGTATPFAAGPFKVTATHTDGGAVRCGRITLTAN